MTLTTLLERLKILADHKVPMILHTGTETLVGPTRRVLPLIRKEQTRGGEENETCVHSRALSA
jgi:hypothetical protein